MSNRGDFSGREEDTSQYTSEQVEAVLGEIGVDVDYETENDFVGYCPFHGNRNTPSFSVSRTKGKYICFNGSCGISGSLVELVKDIGRKNEFEARRLIVSKKKDQSISFTQQLAQALNPVSDFKEFPQATIDRLSEDFWDNDTAISYMRSRKFEDETLRRFEVGFSAKKNLVTVPMHTQSGMPIGLIGRSPSDNDKQFKNSLKLPTSKTLFNLHRARRHGEAAIVVEASFDAMRVDQAGYPNVVSCLSGNFSPYHAEQLDRNFNTVIIMTDFDDKKKHITVDCAKCRKNGSPLCVGHNPGRDLGNKIAKSLPMKRILWASYDDKVIYPRGAKDPGDMTDDEIRRCLKNAVSNFTYREWGLY